MIYPLALRLEGRRVLVLGAGAVGVRKAEQLLEAGAHVDLIALEALATLPSGLASYRQRAYRYGDLRGYSLVVSAMNNPSANDVVVREADERGIWLNVVDDPARCSYYFMALHRDGDVTVAVSSDGAAPALAQVVRDIARDALPSNLAALARRLRAERHALHAVGASSEGLAWATRIRSLLRWDGDRGGAVTPGATGNLTVPEHRGRDR